MNSKLSTSKKTPRKGAEEGDSLACEMGLLPRPTNSHPAGKIGNLYLAELWEGSNLYLVVGTGGGHEQPYRKSMWYSVGGVGVGLGGGDTLNVGQRVWGFVWEKGGGRWGGGGVVLSAALEIHAECV